MKRYDIYFIDNPKLSKNDEMIRLEVWHIPNSLWDVQGLLLVSAQNSEYKTCLQSESVCIISPGGRIFQIATKYMDKYDIVENHQSCQNFDS